MVSKTLGDCCVVLSAALPVQLLGERELSELVEGVYFTILDKICIEHFHMALDIGQNGRCCNASCNDAVQQCLSHVWLLTPVADPKLVPVGHFCLVVGNVNNNMHLVDKLFREVIFPCIQ